MNVYRASLGERGPWSDVWRGECKWLGEGWSELAYSYNGLYWNRTNRQPIIGRDDPGERRGFWTDCYIIGYDDDQRLRWVVKRNTNSHAVRGFLSQAEMKSKDANGDGTDVLPPRMPYTWRHATILRSNGLGRVGLRGWCRRKVI